MTLNPYQATQIGKYTGLHTIQHERYEGVSAGSSTWGAHGGFKFYQRMQLYHRHTVTFVYVCACVYLSVLRSGRMVHFLCDVALYTPNLGLSTRRGLSATSFAISLERLCLSNGDVESSGRLSIPAFRLGIYCHY